MFVSTKFHKVQNHFTKSFVIEQFIEGGQDSQINVELVVVTWNFKFLACHFQCS